MGCCRQAFREREGHADVPDRYVEDGEKLGSWLSTQRTRYKARGLSEAERKRRRASALSDGEVERLEAVGVVWQRRGPVAHPHSERHGEIDSERGGKRREL